MFQSDGDGAYRRIACRKYFDEKYNEIGKNGVSIDGKTYNVPIETSEDCNVQEPIEFWYAVDQNGYDVGDLYNDDGSRKYYPARIEVNSPYTSIGFSETGRGSNVESYFGIYSDILFSQDIGNSSDFVSIVDQWSNINFPATTDINLVSQNNVERLAKAILKGGDLDFETVKNPRSNSLYYILWATENQKIYFNAEELKYFYWGYIANRYFNFSLPEEAGAFACSYLGKDAFGYPISDEFEIAPWNWKALRCGWIFSLENENWPIIPDYDINMYEPRVIHSSYLPDGLSFADMVDMALWITPGTATAKKITIKIASHMFIAAYVDWQIQMVFNMLKDNSFEESVAMVDYSRVLWSGLTSHITDFKTKASFNCIRAAVDKILETKDVTYEAGVACGISILSDLLFEELVADFNSPYHIALFNIFKGKTRSQIVDRLRTIGFEPAEINRFLDLLPASILKELN